MPNPSEGRPAQGRSRPGSAARRPRPDATRLVAFELLRAVDERAAYANLAMPGLLRQHGLHSRDAAFATELGFGTLRRQGTYDAVIAACVDRPIAQVDRPVLDVLRLGAHQLLSMRVPSHAAVSATVELGRAVLGEGRGRFVNAVLRKVAAQDLDTWVLARAPAFDRDPVGHLSIATSHPVWIVDAVRRALDGDLAETAAALAADNVAAPVTLAVHPGRASVGELLEAGADPGRWSPYAAVLRGGDPGAVPAVAQGRAGVQDEGSQLVALAVAGAPVEGADARWLDLCAGPGGKASLLEGLARDVDARLLASELQPHRARLVAGAVGQGAATVVADGRAPAWASGAFDRAIVDVPCSGLGALRRRPEARWRRGPDHVDALAPLQRALLRTALDAVRPGGVVGYVTCSPHPAETRAVVTDVLADSGAADLLDARPYLPADLDSGAGPDVQLWPHRHGTDAMYLALLRRR